MRGQPYPGDLSQPPRLGPRRSPHCPGGGHRAGSEVPSGRPAAGQHPTAEGSASREALGAPGAVTPESGAAAVSREQGAGAPAPLPAARRPGTWRKVRSSGCSRRSRALRPKAAAASRWPCSRRSSAWACARACALAASMPRRARVCRSSSARSRLPNLPETTEARVRAELWVGTEEPGWPGGRRPLG